MKLNVLGNTLDKEQTKVALINNKNTIIIAGAGSGKSLTMVGKIKYLVNTLNIDINEILCITFTNAAAKSLQDKIKKETGLDNKVYTFHKLALHILNEFKVPYKIANDDLLDYVTNEIFYAIGIEPYFKNLFLNKNYLYSPEFTNYKNTIIKFIHLFISNYTNISDFNKLIKKAKISDIPYLKIIKKILEQYILEKESQGLIDFDDMIMLATNLVKENNLEVHYRYIIIDEYQDTSKIRENLVREIKNKTNAYVTVVGDDFQSIYRFSGCDINNFLDFTKNFKPSKKIYLTNTYRNSKELIRVAGDFIMENKRQIKKKLKSKKSIKKPIVIYFYKHKNDIKKLLNIMPKNLMVLGRNNQDLYTYFSNFKINNDKICFEDKNIYFKTIHKSKGLEEENVFIVNLTNDINSLPSKIKEEDILKYVTKKDMYPHEEERRLFYVALTRTKNYCYLFVPKKNPSIFIEELIKHYKEYITIINL